jgi:hypothetical protein
LAYILKGLLFGFGPGSGDTAFTSNTPFASVNTTLGFSFPYENSVFTSVSINVNGLVSLNSTANIYAYFNTFNGTVFYRQVSKTTLELGTASGFVRSTYGNLFSAAEAFVVTWYD